MRLAPLSSSCSRCFAAPVAHAQWEYLGPGRIDGGSFVADGSVTYLNARVLFGSTLSRSDDGGRTWTDISDGLDLGGPSEPPFIESMDASGGTIAVLVSDNAGSRGKKRVYLSTNGGVNWTLSQTLEDDEADHVVVVDASTIVTYYRISNVNALPLIFVTTDTGATWSAQTVSSNTFAGKSTTNRIVSAGGSIFVEQAGNVLYSSDEGATWSSFTLPNGTNFNYVGSSTWSEGERYYTWLISPFRQLPTRLVWTDNGGQNWEVKEITGAVPSSYVRSKGDMLVSVQRPGIINYSLDQGSTWQAGDASGVIAQAGYSSSGGADATLQATDAGFLYLPNGNNEARVYFSVDAIDWTPVQVPAMRVDFAPIRPVGGALLASMGSGAYFRSADGGSTWRRFDTFDGECSNSGGLMTSIDGVGYALCREHTFRSEDGLEWTETGTDGPGPDYFFSGGNALYALDLRRAVSSTGGRDGTLFRSTDEGASWEQLATDLALQSTPSVSGNRIAMADAQPFVFRGVRLSVDGGATFTESQPAINGSYVAAAVTPASVFAGGAGIGRNGVRGVQTFFRSRDDGQTWEDLIATGKLAAGPISLHTTEEFVVAVHYDSVSVSNDDGDTWTSIAEGWPADVNQPSRTAFVVGDTLYVQLGFSGLWRASLSAAGIVTSTSSASALADADLRVWPSPTRGDVRIQFALDRNASVRIVAYDLLGREVARIAERSLNAGQESVDWSASSLAPGIYLIRMTTDRGQSQTARFVKL